jgi:2-methylisocitrate lyase-like PEP mutase family enzyme
MLAAAARIAIAVNVPVTVDAEAGYGMEPTDLVARLKGMGAAGCNLEDTTHATGELRDPVDQADWLRAVRGAASEQGMDSRSTPGSTFFYQLALPGRDRPNW